MRNIVNRIASNKVVNNMKKLYPKWEVEKRIRDFYFEKIKYCLCILEVGVFVIIAASNFSSESVVNKDGMITRNGYGEGDKKVTFEVKRDSKFADESELEYESKPEIIDVTISEQRINDEEVRKLSKEFNEKLMREILSDNKSFDHVDSNLNFVTKLEGYPFKVSYKTTKPLILSSKGEIDEERLRTAISEMNGEDSDESIGNEKEENCKADNKENNIGIAIGITATVTYFDYEEENIFYVCLYERQLSEAEEFTNTLASEIEKQNNESIYEEFFILPEFINGERVSFSEKKQNNSIFLAIITLLSGVASYILKDKEIEKETQIREKQLIREYPRLINKFTLFYNAGMPIKTIWMKICSDYIKDLESIEKRNKDEGKNYLYEEMLITRKQILDGKRELEAYEEFAKRVNIKRYRVFINLISQAIVIGKKDLSLSLKLECDDAFLERKNNAKQLFEEASTKLLGPMFMMLFVIMIIIMFPAIYSFKM